MEDLIKQLKEKKVKKVYVQFPEGLKTKMQEIADNLEKECFEVILSCEPMWGACDIRVHEAVDLGCDGIINIGHTSFGVTAKIPIFYWPYRLEYDPLPALEKEFYKIEKFNSFNLVSTAQHIECLPEVKKFLENKNKKVLAFGKPGISKQVGQVLGCDQAAALQGDADCILFVGSGRFHPLGIVYKTQKPVFSLSTDKNEIIDFSRERDKWIRIKLAQIEKAKEGKNFGIVVSTKPGQMYIRQAEVLKKKLEGMGKKSWILVMDFITKEKLMGLKLDALVNCACPRLDEDYQLFGMPVLNPADVDKLQ